MSTTELCHARILCAGRTRCTKSFSVAVDKALRPSYLCSFLVLGQSDSFHVTLHSCSSFPVRAPALVRSWTDTRVVRVPDICPDCATSLALRSETVLVIEISGEAQSRGNVGSLPEGCAPRSSLAAGRSGGSILMLTPLCTPDGDHGDPMMLCASLCGLHTRYIPNWTLAAKSPLRASASGRNRTYSHSSNTGLWTPHIRSSDALQRPSRGRLDTSIPPVGLLIQSPTSPCCALC